MLARSRMPRPVTTPPGTTAGVGTGQVLSLHMLSASEGWRGAAPCGTHNRRHDVLRRDAGWDRFRVGDLRRDGARCSACLGGGEPRVRTFFDIGLPHRGRWSTWVALRIQAGASGLTFVDASHGWAVAGATSPDRQTQTVELLRTTDGGTTWVTAYQTVEPLDGEHADGSVPVRRPHVCHSADGLRSALAMSGRESLCGGHAGRRQHLASRRRTTTRCAIWCHVVG